jgi:hypothetical protein
MRLPKGNNRASCRCCSISCTRATRSLVVTRIDRSVEDPRDIVHELKAKSVYKGRKPRIDAAEVRRLREGEGLGPSAIARRLGIGRASGYRVLGGGKGREGASAPAARSG